MDLRKEFNTTTVLNQNNPMLCSNSLFPQISISTTTHLKSLSLQQIKANTQSYN